MMDKQYFYISQNWGIYIGHLLQNKMHKHHALQISVALGTPINIETADKVLISEKAIFIERNVGHKIIGETLQCIFLINPFSHLSQVFQHFKTGILEDKFQEKIQFLSLALLQQNMEQAQFISEIENYIHQFQCACDVDIHIEDKRIEKVYQTLLTSPEVIFKAKEMANLCFLSEDRFLHLFKEQTGVTFRSTQLWNRLRLSVLSLHKSTITEVAHQFGFSDSAHYSRSFKDCFGISPRLILKNSQFIQVSS